MLKRTIAKICFVLVCLFLLVSNSSNPPNGRTGAPGEGNCNNCHSGGASFNGMISISGIPADVEAGVTYPILLSVTNPNGLASEGGFQMVALNASDLNSGTLSNPGPNSTISTSAGRTYHEHNPSQNFPGNNTLEWTVDWTAPSGPNNESITFYMAGNIANGNGNTSGDKIVYNSVTTNLIGGIMPVSVIINLLNDVSCNGGNDGSAEAIASDGSPPYTYNWSNGEVGSIATNLEAGTHTVTVTDFAGGTATASVVVNEPPALQISHAINNDVSCFGGNDGSVSLNASGGSPGYNYQWDDGSSSQTNNNLSAGTHSYTITDSNGCAESGNVFINQPDLVEGALQSSTEPTCFGASDGNATVIAVGGTPGYTYAWSNGGSGTSQNNLSAGNYIITFTDINGCTGTFGFSLAEPAELIIGLDSLVQIDCFGNNNGIIDANASGGTMPYSFNWSTGSSSDKIENLEPGMYNLTVTDQNACSATEEFTITEPNALELMVSLDQTIVCHGDSTGLVTASATGGTSPYAYSWSDGSTGPTVPNLPAGTISCTVTDSNSCQDSFSIEITQPAELLLNMSATNETTAGAGDGTATVNVTGGTPPYSYLWSNDSTTQTISNLIPGTYIVTVTDNNGCTESGSVAVSVGACELEISTASSDPSCHGFSDGSISVTATGGNDPLVYEWSDGSMGADLQNIPAGTYSVTVTDSNNCTASAEVTLDDPDSLSAEIIIVNYPQCEDDSTGVLDVIVAGGTAPYSLAWEGNAGPNFPAGNYSLLVTDANGCTAETNVLLENMDTTAPEIQFQNIILYVDAFGETQDIIAEDFDIGTTDNCPGIIDYEFVAGPFDCDDIMSTFTISVIVSDQSGNAAEGGFNVTVLDTIPPEIICGLVDPVISCVPIVIEYPTPVFMDNCPGGTIELVSGIGSGKEFPVGINEEIWVATDLSGNKDTCVIVIEVSSEILVDIQTINESCTELCDGEAIVNISGGTPPYVIDPTDLMNLCPGTYTISVADANGCVTTAQFDIDAAPEFSIASIEATDASAGVSDGSIDLEITGGELPLGYEWFKDGVSFAGTQDLSDLGPGEYECIITDANGCEITTGVIVIEMESSLQKAVDPFRLQVYPNPANEILTVEIQNNYMNRVAYRFTDIDGRFVTGGSFDLNNKLTLQISDWDAGVYVMSVISQGSLTVKRVLILD